MDIKDLKGLMEAYSEVYVPQEVDEATAMAKRGYDEAPIRQKIAKSTGGGAAADRASALEKKSTFGDAKKEKQRQNLARAQRGDFRKTTSSSPGLRGYAHKSDDAKVKEKQAARGAQRGALTPAEKKQFNREEFDIFDVVLEFLQAEGYAETLEEAEWMMANVIDEKAVAIILEAMHEDEDEEDEKEMKKGKKSKKEKEEEDEEELDEALTGERYKKAVKKPGGTAYSRMVSADPKKRATRGGRGGESDFGAGDRGSGNKAARRSGTYQEEEFAIDEGAAGDVASRAQKLANQRKGQTPERKKMYQGLADRAAARERGPFKGGTSRQGMTPAERTRSREAAAYQADVHGGSATYGKGSLPKGKKLERQRARGVSEKFELWLDEAMSNYEKNRKRASQRAAARNAARDQGKTGAVPGVGYVTPRRERETWTDESGKTRHAKGL